MHCMAGGNNVRQQFATTNVEAEKEETHASVDKQESMFDESNCEVGI